MAKKKEKKAGKRMKKSEMSERLISLFHTKPNETFSLKQLSSSLNLTTHPLKMLCADIITEMIEDDFLQEVEKGHYKLNDHGLIMTGVFQRKSNGKNSFIPDDGGETIFIAERNSAHAMNNDKVKITAPLILTVKPKETKENIDFPKDENRSLYWQLFKQLGQYKQLWYIYIFAALFSASTTQLAVFTNQILIDEILPSYNLGMLIMFAIGLGIYKLFDLGTSIYKAFVGIHLGNVLD